MLIILRKIVSIFLLSLIFQNCIAQPEPKYGLYFGNAFISDSVTVIINGVRVVKNLKLKRRMYDPKNLMIVQDDRRLMIMPFNGPLDTLKKIDIRTSLLILDICMNNIWRRFSIDLRKGKYLYAGYKYFRMGWSCFKVLEISQDTLPPIFI